MFFLKKKSTKTEKNTDPVTSSKTFYSYDYTIIQDTSSIQANTVSNVDLREIPILLVQIFTLGLISMDLDKISKE